MSFLPLVFSLPVCVLRGQGFPNVLSGALGAAEEGVETQEAGAGEQMSPTALSPNYFTPISSCIDVTGRVSARRGLVVLAVCRPHG